MAQIPLASITVPGTPAALLDAMRQFELDAVEGRLTCQRARRSRVYCVLIGWPRTAPLAIPRAIRLLPRSGPP